MHSSFLLFIFLCQSAFSQTRAIDSLETKLSQVSGTGKIDVLNQLAYEFISRDNQKAMSYCDEALALGIQSGYQRGIGRAYTYRGVYEYLSAEFSNGRSSLKRGLEYALKSNDVENQGYTLMQIGNSYLDQPNLDSAEYFYMKSYTILKDSLHPLNLSKLYKNLSRLYGLKSELSLQKRYLTRSLRIRESLKDQAHIADALITLAAVYITEDDYAAANLNLDRAWKILQTNPDDLEELNDWRHQKALILLSERKFDQALPLLDSAAGFYARNEFLQEFVILKTDLGRNYHQRGEYEAALESLYEALNVAKLQEYNMETANIQLQIGWVNYELKELNQSLAFGDMVLHWAEKNGARNRTADALALKGIAFTESKKFKDAEVSLKKALSIRQQLNDRSGMGEAYELLGYLEQTRGNFELSIELYETSLKFSELSNYDYGRVWALLGLGSVNLKLGRIDQASGYLHRAEIFAKQINAKEVLINVYKARKDLLAKQGKFKESLWYADLAYHLNDSLHRSEVSRKFANLQQIAEIKERDKNINSLMQEKQLAQDKINLQELKLKQQSYVNTFGIVIILLLGTLAFIYALFYFKVKRLNGEVNHQKTEIEVQSRQLSDSNNYINQLNRSLEGMVAEKTNDLKITIEQLIGRNSDLQQYSYTVSHNLRGPVARQLGLTNLLLKSRDAAEQNQLIDLIHKTSCDLDHILKDLNKVINIQKDLHNLKELVKLEDGWIKSSELLKDVIHDHFRITCKFDPAPELVTIRAFIQSIFYNLMSNAIKYRSPDRLLKLHGSSFREDNRLVIEISDNGLGIDLNKYEDSIFKLFKRFHTHVEGRGLGLFLVKSQIEALQGSLEIQSVVDRGTSFKITIPYRVEAGSTHLIHA
ncbi:MAG TPA: ATP-binding protein [Chryseolinea sp.]